MRIELKIICFLTGFYMLTACKPTGQTATSDTEIMKSQEAFFSSVLNNSLQFNTFTSRLKIDVVTPQKEFSARGQLKMIYNERFQISIQPLLGIEMFRIEMTPDSVKILDRMNKCYLTDTYDSFNRSLNLDFRFSSFQGLLTNRLFVPDKATITSQDFRLFRVSNNKTDAEFRIKDVNGLIYTFNATGDEKLTSVNIAKSPDSDEIVCKYNDFRNVTNCLFPMEMSLKLLTGGISKGTATFGFSSAETDVPVNMDFKIPQGYSRVTVSQLMKSLGQK